MMTDLHSSEQRIFPRRRKTLNFDLRIGGETYHARVTDFSLCGLGLVIKDIKTPDLPDFDLMINDLGLDARGRAIWTKSISGGLRAGVRTLGPLKGKLACHRLSDILLGIQRLGKTGILELEAGPSAKKLFFRDGGLILPESQRLHADKTLIDLFDLKDCSFLFKEVPPPVGDMLPLGLSIEYLIYRGISALREAERVRAYCPPLRAVLSASSDYQDTVEGSAFAEAARRILAFVDCSRTVGDILSLLPGDELQTLNPISPFYHMQLIDTVEDESTDTSAGREPDLDSEAAAR